VFDSARLIFDLQKVNAIIQNVSGDLDPSAIAQEMTDALVTEFNCALVRIWLTQANGEALRLVASSGLYTRTNGSFARVPMGAYKVGKIAQNCVPFLSNHLAEESWVKDREWAIANQIYGFAGYPLKRRDRFAGSQREHRVIGVLAAFSHAPFAPEFLEVLQVLCMAATTALDSAIRCQQNYQGNPSSHGLIPSLHLSDYLSSILKSTHLKLMGTEQRLTPSLAYLLVRITEIFNQINCSYCHLSYGEKAVILEGIVAASDDQLWDIPAWEKSHFDELAYVVNHLGGKLNIQLSSYQQVIQITLQFPYCDEELATKEASKLSQREQEVIVLLTQGLRDREIAQKLHISESTVKFHLNNTLTKLKAKNRYQAIYQATVQGLI